MLTWMNRNIEKFLVATLFIAFSSLMILNVLMILLTKEALAWASEVVMLLFVFFVWVSISFAFKERKHIRVTGLIDLLPGKVQQLSGIAVNFISIVFFAILVTVGLDWMMHPSVQTKHSLLLNYPMWLFYLSAPLGGTLSIIRIVQNTIDDIKMYRKESA